MGCEIHNRGWEIHYKSSELFIDNGDRLNIDSLNVAFGGNVVEADSMTRKSSKKYSSKELMIFINRHRDKYYDTRRGQYSTRN